MDYPLEPQRYSWPPRHDSWFAPLSIDLVIKVSQVTFLHPFVCWIVPLSFRAQEYPWDHPRNVAAIAWASFVSLCWAVSAIHSRLAFGRPRKVDMTKEVIVITGGASGLGLLLAEVYGMRGASVAVLDVSEMDTTEVRGLTYYKCNVTDKEEVARVAKKIKEDLGTPTVLVNNAAVVTAKPILEATFQQLEKAIATNLTAHFYTIKTFIPMMIQSAGGRGGTIVSISSVVGHLGAAQLSDYAATKAAVTALHRSLTAEMRATHPEIRTVVVEPGQLTTPMFYGMQTPSNFWVPLVEPVDLVKEIVAAIDGGHNPVVALPFYARWVDYYNIFPSGLQSLLRKWTRLDEVMTTFVGSKGWKEQKEK